MPEPSIATSPPGFMGVFFVIFGVLFVAVVVVIVVAWTRNWRAARRAGLDPLAAQTQVAGRLYNSGALAAARSPQQRLAELEELRAKGLVAQAEYDQIRSRILADL